MSGVGNAPEGEGPRHVSESLDKITRELEDQRELDGPDLEGELIAAYDLYRRLEARRQQAAAHPENLSVKDEDLSGGINEASEKLAVISDRLRALGRDPHQILLNHRDNLDQTQSLN